MKVILFSLAYGVLAHLSQAEEPAPPRAEEKAKVGFDPSLYAGTYTLNPSDSDEMATVKIRFRKATEREVEGDTGFVADGTLDNSFHGTVVQFTGAQVNLEKGGEVTVFAQFFGFTLKKGVLKWAPNYTRTLYREKEEPSATKPDSGPKH